MFAKFRSSLDKTIRYHTKNIDRADRGDDPFPVFVESYMIIGHRNILVSGAIMVHVIRHFSAEDPYHVQHQVPRALGGLTLFCATLSIYMTLAFMNKLRCSRSSPTFATRWSRDAGAWRSSAGYTVYGLLLAPLMWSACAIVFYVCYRISTRIYTAIDCETGNLCAPMQLDMKVSVAVFMAGAVKYSLSAFIAFLRIGR